MARNRGQHLGAESRSQMTARKKTGTSVLHLQRPEICLSHELGRGSQLQEGTQPS